MQRHGERERERDVCGCVHTYMGIYIHIYIYNTDKGRDVHAFAVYYVRINQCIRFWIGRDCRHPVFVHSPVIGLLPIDCRVPAEHLSN